MISNRKLKKIEKQKKLRNKKLIKKYPWLIPRDWNGKVYSDYDYSWINWFGWPSGWNKTLGNMYLKEFGDTAKKLGIEKEIVIEQQKEKYGQMRNYFYPYEEDLAEIANKYEVISQNVCIACGKPDVPMVGRSWISPICFDCYKNNIREREEYFSKGTITSDEQIKEEYNSEILSDSMIPDRYEVKQWKPGEEEKIITYDISTTVKKIRKKWYKHHEEKDNIS